MMRYFLFMLLLFPLASYAQSGIITTIAGVDSAGYCCDGQPAIKAALRGPESVAVDKYGNIFISDAHDHRIRKIDPAGIISTIAGLDTGGYSGDGGLAAFAHIRTPVCIIVDHTGNLYFSELNNYIVRKIDASGMISTVAGTGIQGYSGDGGPAKSAQLTGPIGLALDKDGNLYICDSWSNTIRKVDKYGIIHTIAGSPTDCAFSGDGGPAADARFCLPTSIAIDPKGNLYITDAENYRVRKINTAGIISTIAGRSKSLFGGDDGPAADATFVAPYSIISDAHGSLYISDCYDHRIRKIDTFGMITTIAGRGRAGFSGDGGLATSAHLNIPCMITLDTGGNMFIADGLNARIRKITKVAPSVNIREADVHKSNAVTVYPNPSNGIFYYDALLIATVYDLSGRNVYHSKRADRSVDIKGPPGTYILELEDEAGNRQRQPIIIR